MAPMIWETRRHDVRSSRRWQRQLLATTGTQGDDGDDTKIADPIVTSERATITVRQGATTAVACIDRVVRDDSTDTGDDNE